MTLAIVVVDYINKNRLSRLNGSLGFVLFGIQSILGSDSVILPNGDWISPPSVPRHSSLLHLHRLPERSVHIYAVDSDAALPNINGLDIETGELESLSVPRVLSS